MQSRVLQVVSNFRIQSAVSRAKSSKPRQFSTKPRTHSTADIVSKFTSIKELRHKTIPRTINLLYSPSVVPSYQERETFFLTRNSRRVKYEHEFVKKAKDQLYWTFVPHTSKSFLPTKCVRNHYRRKWRMAFATALKQHGFDFHGRKLPAAPGQPKTLGLQGTLEVRLFNAPNLEDTDQSGMVGHANNIIRALMEKQQSGLQTHNTRSLDVTRPT